MSCRRVELSRSTKTRPTGSVCEVRDHGPGVPAAQARAVFTPFERGDEDHGEHPGIGLGLALSRNLARDLGGELSLRPPNGDGACFRLELPL